MRGIVLSTAAVFALVLVLAGCGNSSPGTTATTVTTGISATTASSSTVTTIGETTTATARSSTVGSRENPIPIGTEAQVGDWKIKVTEVILDAGSALANQTVYEPLAAGNQYVMTKLTATYAGKESGTFMADMMYEIVGSGGNTFGTAQISTPDGIQDQGEVFPGASVSGNLVFEVASNQVAGGSLMLEPSFSFDAQRVFFAIDAIRITTTTTQVTSATIPSADLARYQNDMKSWRDKYNPQFQAQGTVFDELTDPLNATPAQVKKMEDFASVATKAANDLKSIKPPADLASPHSVYAEALAKAAKAATQLASALKTGSASGILDAFATLSDVMSTDSGVTEAKSTLEKALGFPLSSS